MRSLNSARSAKNAQNKLSTINDIKVFFVNALSRGELKAIRVYAVIEE